MTLKDNGDGTFSITAPCQFKKIKPLEVSEIEYLADKFGVFNDDWYEFNEQQLLNFAREIEKAHGIS